MKKLLAALLCLLPLFAFGANLGVLNDMVVNPTNLNRIQSATNRTRAMEGYAGVGGLALNRLSFYHTNVASPSAPTTAVGAAGTLAGVYIYAVTFVTTNGETAIGASAASVNPVSQVVNVSGIPVGGAGLGVIARKVYRSDEFGVTPLLLLTNIPNNTTTSFTDDTPDSSLGLPPPANNTTAGRWYANGVPIMFIDHASGNMYVGIDAGLTNLLGLNNVAFGPQALRGLSNGNNNVAMGATALRDFRLGDGNSAFGGGALDNLVLGEFNIAYGQDALGTITNGFRNNAFGRDTLFRLERGNDNAGYGDFAGENLRIGTNNLYLGSHADGQETNSHSGAIGHYAKIEKDRHLVIGTTNAAITYTQAVFHIPRIGIMTNNPTYALQIYQPDISMAAIDITYAAGAGNTRGIQLHNGFGFTNFYVGVGGDMFVGGSIRLGAEGGSQPAMLYVTNHGTGPSFLIDGLHGANQFIVLTNGNVGIGTATPTQALHVVGSAVITGGSPAAGKVLTAVDSNGYAAWSNAIGSAAFSDSNNAALYLFSTNRVNYFQLSTADNIQTNNTILAPTNANAGALALQPGSGGTNQLTAVPLANGQYLTYNGTAYVPSNLPPASAGASAENITSRRTSVRLWDECLHGALSTTAPAGELGLLKTISGSAAQAGAGAGHTNAPGVLQLTTGTTTTGRASINADSTGIIFGGNGATYTNEWRVRWGSLPGSGEDWTNFVGFIDVYTTTPTDGVYFQIDTNNANFVCVARSNGTQSSVTNTTAIVAGTWYKLRITINSAATSAVFTVNDADSQTLTSNIPNSTISRSTGLGASLIKNLGTTAATLDIDYIGLDFDMNVSR